MGGTAGQSVTLANSIIGVGILAMPFCFQQCGAVLAVLMLLVSGLVSRLACYFLLKSAILARRRNFEFLAFHVFGAPGKLAVEVGIIGFLMGTCIAYFVVVGDLGPQIICKMFNINQSDILRTCVMVLVSLACVLPLGLLRNVDSLSNVSAATIGFYFCLVIKVIAEATSQLFNGDWQSRIELWRPEGVLQCVPIFSMALFCQTQLFEIFETLPTLSLEKMSVVTKNALNICTAVYVLVGIFGYIAFCGQTISGNILVSLSPTMASDVIKLGFVMSLAFSFPLIIFPCRASLYSLLYRKVLPSHHDHIINHTIPAGTFRCITVGIVAVSLLVSLMIPNIELVLGLVGSTIGVVVCVLFPAACFINLTLKNTNERLLAKVILCLGIIVMVLGTYANLQAAESKLDHSDNRYTTQDKIDKIVQEFFENSNNDLKSVAPASDQDIIKNVKDLEDAPDKNSEVQPPNPVAPDQQSDENKKIEIQPLLPAVIVKEGSKYKLDQNEIEGGGDKESAVEVNGAHNNLAKPEEKQLEVNDKVVDSIIANSAANQEHLKILKQQELIETIKKHGQEQKQLIEEQKDILDNIKKTKLEIEKSKKENLDQEQVKKLAVESIKKMADIAIKSISGVTNRPIKEAKQIDSVVNTENKQIVADPSAVFHQAVHNLEQIRNANVINPQPDTEKNIISVNKNVEYISDSVPNVNVINNEDVQIKDILNEQPNNLKVDNQTSNTAHIHSPDEPKSYIQGENMEQIKQVIPQQRSPLNADALTNNVPIPIIMQPNLQNNLLQAVDTGKNSMGAQSNNVQKINGKAESSYIQEKLSREKRDIDCMKHYLKASEEEKSKCRSVDRDLVNNGITIIIPDKLSDPDSMNLNKVDLLQKPRQVDTILHQVRSLKSVDESELS